MPNWGFWGNLGLAGSLDPPCPQDTGTVQFEQPSDGRERAAPPCHTLSPPATRNWRPCRYRESITSWSNNREGIKYHMQGLGALVSAQCALLCATVCYCVLLCATVCYCVLLCATVCYCALLCATVRYCALLCATVCYCALLCATVCPCALLYSPVRYCALLCTTVRYCTPLCATVR